MRVIPVLDLMAGRAVRAGGGRRGGYAPVHSVLLPEERAGDALALAGAFRDRLGRDEWYVADLDAITGGAPQQALLDALAVAGGRLLVDAAVTTPRRAHDVLTHGAERVVVGLETLSSFDALRDIATSVGRERIVFSLDLRGGEPIVLPGAPHGGTPLELVRAAIDAGAGAILVIDLARVGTGLGLDRPQVDPLRRRERPRDPSREILRQHLHRRVRDGQKRAITLREHVARLPAHGDRHRVAFLPNLDLWVLEREEHLVVDLIRQALRDLFYLGEVEHEVGLGIEAALHDDARAVVVAVQRLAAVPGERDEVGRREHEVVFRDGDLELLTRCH